MLELLRCKLLDVQRTKINGGPEWDRKKKNNNKMEIIASPALAPHDVSKQAPMALCLLNGRARGLVKLLVVDGLKPPQRPVQARR